MSWFVSVCFCQNLQLDQKAFFYKSYSVYTETNTPAINWQSLRGVPISTNAVDPGSDGRAPTAAQQQSYGAGYTLAPPTANQFQGLVT